MPYIFNACMDLKYKGRRIAFGFCSVNLPKVPLFSRFHFTLKGSMILVIFFERMGLTFVAWEH